MPMLLLLGLVPIVGAQSGSASVDRQSLFDSMVPDATLSIYKHPMGPDMVDITMRAAAYPPQLLRKQIALMGKYLACDPWGIEVVNYDLDPNNPNMKFTKATFAVNGVIDRQNGTLRLEPFAKALAGAPAPWTVEGLEVRFQGEQPSSRMIQYWRSGAATVEGRFEDDRNPKMSAIVYRIHLTSQDPAKIDIPEPSDYKSPNSHPAGPKPAKDWTPVALLSVAALAGGALVYSLLLRGRPKARF